MIELGWDLGMDVIAEGVESSVLEDFLRSLGCQFAQGFHLAKPMPSHKYRLLLIGESGQNIGILPSRDDSIG